MVSLKKILIIGGGGYVGTVLTDYFLHVGYSVRALDCFLYNNNRSVLAHLGHTQYEFVYGDLRDSRTLEAALEGVTDVVLLAGLVGDPITKKYPKVSKEINEEGMRECINLIGKKRGISKLIFASTCSNYGIVKDNRLADETSELKPLSVYAQSKVGIEQYILSLRGGVYFSPTILRFATAFGLSPRMRFDLTVNEFTLELASGNRLEIYDANTWRPYCHVRDFALLMDLVLKAPESDVAFEIFNAGGKINNYTKQGVVDIILDQLPDGRVTYADNGSDPRNYRVNFNKVKDKLGFEPKYTVLRGVKELLSAIRDHVFDDALDNKGAYGNILIREYENR